MGGVSVVINVDSAVGTAVETGLGGSVCFGPEELVGIEIGVVESTSRSCTSETINNFYF